MPMRALLLENYSAPFTLADVPRPVAHGNHVLVRIKASGVNPLDIKIRAGKGGHASMPLPAVLGLDLAGTVEEVGPDVSAFKPGDEVYGMTGGVGGLQGSLAEFASVDSDLLALKPANLTMREAAALPLSVITAWEGLVDRANVQPGHTVLVHAGAGGVGHVVVQLALAFGAKVFATVSDDKKSIVERFGATPINYKNTPVDQYVAEHTHGEGFDIVYDTVDGTTLDDSFAAIKVNTGHVVSCLGRGPHNLTPLSLRGATYSGVFTLIPLLTGKGRRHHGDILRQATALVESGKLAPLLNPGRFTLETALAAHQAVEAGASPGKVVVEIAS